MKRISLFIAALFAAVALSAATKPKSYTVSSPDGNLVLTVQTGDAFTYSLSRQGEVLIAPSEIGVTLAGGTVLGGGAKVQKAKSAKVERTAVSPVYKSALIRDCFNSLTLITKTFDLEFRVYDEGAAWRFVPKMKGAFEVASESANFNFPGNWKGLVPYSSAGRGFFTSFESHYTETAISGWDPSKLAFLPVLVEAPSAKILITESGLTNYPGMFLDNADGDLSLNGVFAPYPKTRQQGGHNMLQMLVTETEPFIAKFDSAEPLPWRIILVAADDIDLLDADMPWLLGEEPQGDFSWVKPGKVAWDWWNDWNLYGVPFKAGINTETYKYYIDFAAEKGIEYVILDEGWAVNMKADLFQVIPEIDLPEIISYGGRKGVGIILWAGYWAFERDMEKVCSHYADMGVKGFKVDFMDGDSQMIVDFYTRAAAMTAKYGMLIDFHGAFKPSGLHRTYPNVINYEGVFGLENMKWAAADVDQVTYDVQIPFIRNVAGPMDYTQGAMRNATRGNYRPVYNEPMSQGTRCRQLAEYTVFFAPLTMLCDSPSNYLAEPECTDFIASVPTVWDQSVPLCGKVGEYVAIARRYGETWYVGALTNWDGRDLELDLSFLGEGSYSMEVFEDGPNAWKAARDYSHYSCDVPSSRKVAARMVSGGGWTAKITRN